MILNFFNQLFGFAGSLCLLLFGMNMLSNGIQKGAGSGLQKLLSKITGNRIKAVLTGIGVTAVIQSSGATTVMVVSFVNAEILSLEQAIGVIFGANIGTTVTAWIVSLFGFSFSISAAAIPLFGFGFILKYFKKFKIHNFADCFMGFALLFMGLGLLKESLAIEGQTSRILTIISNWGVSGILIGVLIGIFVTALIHSSSAMTAIVLTMAANNTLSWELSAAIILGSNIGSTIDAIMSSINASTNARRTAFVHVAFNLVGTLLALCFFKPFLHFIDLAVPGTPSQNITTHISMLHTVFNVCATLIFLPFVNQIAAVSRKVIIDSPEKDDLHYKIPAILPFSHASADIYGMQIEREISKMAAKVMEMFDRILYSLNSKDTIDDKGGQTSIAKAQTSIDKEQKNKQQTNKGQTSINTETQIKQGQTSVIENMENYVDEMDEAITDFLQKCYRLPTANNDDRKHFSKLMHITDSLENLSDECCSIMHTLVKYMNKPEKLHSEKRIKELSEYLELVRVFFEQIITYFTLSFSQKELSEDKLKSLSRFEQKIDDIKKDYKKSSRKRIENGGDVKSELQYIDMIKKIERAGDCVFSILL